MAAKYTDRLCRCQNNKVTSRFEEIRYRILSFFYFRFCRASVVDLKQDCCYIFGNFGAMSTNMVAKTSLNGLFVNLFCSSSNHKETLWQFAIAFNCIVNDECYRTTKIPDKYIIKNKKKHLLTTEERWTNFW